VAEVEQDGRTPPGPAGLLAGRYPGKCIQQLREPDESPKDSIDWRAALQLFHARLRTPQYVYSWPNRRFPEAVGRIPGRRYRQRDDEKPSILVAIDTSASISTEELVQVSRQLLLMSDWAHITVAECDAAIQRVYPFRRALEEVKGRGGTDLRPVFDPDFLRQNRTDGIVYFTDGYGPWPAVAPGIPTLWVLTKRIRFECPFGEKTCLSERA
jgi:predicted metal-dependent peptidase